MTSDISKDFSIMATHFSGKFIENKLVGTHEQ